MACFGGGRGRRGPYVCEVLRSTVYLVYSSSSVLYECELLFWGACFIIVVASLKALGSTARSGGECIILIVVVPVSNSISLFLNGVGVSPFPGDFQSVL